MNDREVSLNHGCYRSLILVETVTNERNRTDYLPRLKMKIQNDAPFSVRTVPLPATIHGESIWTDNALIVPVLT